MSAAYESHTQFNLGKQVTHTISHTNTSGNVLVIALVTAGAGGDIINSMTYAGVACTQQVVESVSNGRTCQVWTLANPVIGTNNLVIALSTSERPWGSIISVTGADTTTPVDATGNGNSGTGSSTTLSITTTTADTLLVGAAYTSQSYSSAGTNTSLVSAYSITTIVRSTSNIATPGATSLVANWSTSSSYNDYAIIAINSQATASSVEVKSIAGISNI